MSIPAGTSVKPRSIFTQTWTIQNTGTTTWTPGSGGYTLNMVGLDSLGAIPLFANSGGTYPPSAVIASGKSIPPGGQASFSLQFIAPEGTGTYTDSFQLNGTTNFGPTNIVQIKVTQTGSTNQYNRSRAVSYANNYAGYVVRDGYFWTNGSGYGFFGTNFATPPTNPIGDDCAHFVSSCIGQQSNLWGGGIYIPSRVPPTYGEPGAARLVTTCLIDPGYAVEVSSLSQMEPGDVIGWNWEGDTNINDLDHVTLYLGNSLTASHAVSALDVSANTYFQSSEPDFVRHLIHIYDAPTLTASVTKNDIVLSWGTNWTGYVLQSSPSLGADATWSKVGTTPSKVGTLNKVTNLMVGQALFYRLELP
ncbi:MAG TPA: NBR1-Ig-like domain-containing protein [Candidatus Saccharimonadales bacterium]|nr:NBR1-Ig-like domain-containing protein [Candidatus Saccharimonadales bacterium]